MSNEHIARGNIFDGPRTFTGATLSANDYDGGIRDISILPVPSKLMGEPLTESAQFALRPELGGLMRISRIARPDALYGASAPAQTFETIGGRS